MAVEGILYEPRSLWSVGYVTRTGGDPGAIIRLDRQHFMNGGKHPITLERLALAPVNYMVRRMAVGNMAPSPTLPFYASSVINRIGVSISAPFRQHYSGSQEFTLATVSPIATNTPAVRSAAGAEPQPGNLWGVTALNFDRDLYVPQTGMVEVQVSGASPGGRPGGAITADGARVYVLMQEAGGNFSGYARGEGWAIVPTLQTVAQPLAAQDEAFPFMLDPISLIEGYPAVVPAAEGAPTVNDTWKRSRTNAVGAVNAAITGTIFKEQAPSNRSGISRFIGMRVMYDQIGYDSDVNGQYAGDPVEPLANRVGCRARNITGANEWWWRPGAPLSLVLDTITPALVYRLPSSITLGPGDTLDVEINVPGILNDQQIGDDISFQIGVSLNGFAAIEG